MLVGGGWPRPHQDPSLKLPQWPEQSCFQGAGAHTGGRGDPQDWLGGGLTAHRPTLDTWRGAGLPQTQDLQLLVLGAQRLPPVLSEKGSKVLSWDKWP